MSTVIKSTTVKSGSIEETLTPFRFTYNINGSTKSISDKDLNSIESATGYATKEFLLNGTDVQTVTFQTYARGLNVNDIISIILPEYKIPVNLTKNAFIVRKIVTLYVGAKALDTITGVRYD